MDKIKWGTTLSEKDIAKLKAYCDKKGLAMNLVVGRAIRHYTSIGI